MKNTDARISRMREPRNAILAFLPFPIRKPCAIGTLCALGALCVLCALCVSCEVETHSKGNIDGNWHLVKIDTLATGTAVDLSENRIFWAFQANLLQLRDNDRPDTVYIMRFAIDGDALALSDPRINDRETGDPVAELTPTLKHLGINQAEELFAIEQLKNTRMTLSSDMLRLTFKKH